MYWVWLVCGWFSVLEIVCVCLCIWPQCSQTIFMIFLFVQNVFILVIIDTFIYRGQKKFETKATKKAITNESTRNVFQNTLTLSLGLHFARRFNPSDIFICCLLEFIFVHCSITQANTHAFILSTHKHTHTHKRAKEPNAFAIRIFSIILTIGLTQCLRWFFQSVCICECVFFVSSLFLFFHFYSVFIIHNSLWNTKSQWYTTKNIFFASQFYLVGCLLFVLIKYGI